MRTMFAVSVIDKVFAQVMGVSKVEWEWMIGNEDAAQRRLRFCISKEKRNKVEIISLYYRSCILPIHQQKS